VRTRGTCVQRTRKTTAGDSSQKVGGARTGFRLRSTFVKAISPFLKSRVKEAGAQTRLLEALYLR
jgi:hypothetical protein